MTFGELGSLVNAGGVVIILIGALWGGYKGLWVYGPTYRDLVRDRDEWKALALRGAAITDVATTVVARGSVLTAEEAQHAQAVVRGSSRALDR